jgi:GAF domain-containing protein
MVEVPSRAGLAALAEQADRIAPCAFFGFVQRLDDNRSSVLYANPHGIVQCTVPASEVPQVLRPTGEDLLQTAALDGSADGSVAWFLRLAGVRHLASAAIVDRMPATRFWVASPRPDTLAADEASELRTAAAAAARLLDVSLPPDAARQRLERLEQAGELTPALLRVLDLHQLLDRVSAITQRCLPNDRVLLRLFSDDLTEVRVFAQSSTAESVPPLPHPMTPAVAGALEFQLVDDHRDDLLMLDHPAATIGARSSIRFAVRFDDRVIGDLTFASLEPGRFTSADVAVGRRLADQTALALAHYRLAEQGRRAAALEERTTNLEVLDGLLATLTGVLDVREVFDRVSGIAQKVLPHDAMSIAELIENGEKVRIHASHGLGDLDEPFDIVVPDPTMVREMWDYRLLDDVHDHPEYAKGPGWAAGMRSMLFVSIRMEGRNYGGLNFYSTRVGHFVHDDVLVARRITDHVALALSHRRLADEARRNEELRARTTSLELLDQLLATMTDAAEVSETFDRISAIAGKVLPHDGLCLVVVLPDGERGIRYVNAGYDAGPTSATVPVIEAFKTPDIDHEIVDDLGQTRAPHDVIPFEFGFRSALRVPIWFDGRLAADLSFQ